jgi:hypothetical protein
MPKDWKVTKTADGATKRTRTSQANKIGGRKAGKAARLMSDEDLQRYAKPGGRGKDRVRARAELERRGVTYA